MAFGLPIKIEYKVGDTRKGRGPNGPWEQVMKTAYGHVKKTEGLDGEELDVYVGKNESSTKVFAITQLKGPEFKALDEQKFMLGFDDAKAAKAAYLANYPDPKIFGGIKEMTLENFKAAAGDPERAGKKLARLMELNLGLLDAGHKLAGVQVMGGAQAQEMMAQLASERGVSSPYIPDLGSPGMHAPRAGSFARAPGMVRSTNGSGQTFKISELDTRTSRIADRIDDVGIGLLAAPYAARGVANTLEHKAGRLGAVGKAARRVADHMHHHENKYELAGLGMVAPGIVHPAAKVVGKVPVRKEKVAELDKFANRYFPDYEYLTEAEKVAFISGLAGLAGRASGAALRVNSGVKNLGQTISHKASTGLAGLQAKRQFAFAQGQSLGAGGTAATARAKGLEAAKPALAKARTPAPAKHVPVVARPAQNYAKPPAMSNVAGGKAPSSSGSGVKPPVTATGGAPAQATTVAPVKPDAGKPFLSGKNIAKGALAGTLGLGMYAGYKGIGAAANIAQGHAHHAPAPMADYSTVGIGG